jgi:U4/U6 small nuclear ribonucleoprotein PRP31
MESTSTLADALLDDLDDLSDVEESTTPRELSVARSNSQNVVVEQEESSSTKLGEAAGAAVVRFLNNRSLQHHLQSIGKAQPSGAASTKEEHEREHQLIVQSNKYLSRLAEELALTHIQLCAAYQPKFPELEEILPNPVQYANTVRVIGNEMDTTKVNDGLSKFLTSNQVLTVTVSASTTAGRLLSHSELITIDKIATYMEQIINTQNDLTQFVESRMAGLAPNVCALIGPTVAARLIGLAGGLEELSKIPACNLQVLEYWQSVNWSGNVGVGTCSARHSRWSRPNWHWPCAVTL